MSTLRHSDFAPVSAGAVAGRYRIERELAKGGMGVVYEVVDERDGTRLALKRLRASSDDAAQELFEREYRTLAAIQHPRIIRVLDYGRDAGELYYTMELLEGRDLYELAPLPFAEACRYLRDVATSLALLHTRRLLHRDVTPRNVRVTPDGHAKLLDFGALTSFGIPERTVGTAPFIPPEALTGAPLDQRADLFSFGALAYWTLTRQHAYPARSVGELRTVWQQNARLLPPSHHHPSIPKSVDALVLGLLELDPMARPGTMAEVVDRLKAIAELPPEDEATQRALAESYLVHVQFVGRDRELAALRAMVGALDDGSGGSALVRAARGLGRTRLLSELALQARLLGVRSVQVDAATYPQPHGVAIAIVKQLLELSPGAREEATAQAAILAQLDAGLAGRLHATAAAPESAVSGDWRARIQEALHGLTAAACREGRLLLAIDNADEADESSLSLLAGVLTLTAEHPLALVLSARRGGLSPASISWRTLEAKSTQLELTPLSSDQTLSLARTIFGDGPNLTRFAERLHERCAGSPLHFMELLRRLHAAQSVRYLEGLWVLPAELPDSDIPAGVEELLAARLGELTPQAYACAEALAVEERSLTRARCVVLAHEESEQPFALIEELVRTDVLEDTLEGYRFRHGAVRDALLERMQPDRRRALHLRCADRLLAQAGHEQTDAQIAAGYHLLRAGETSRGADLLADIAYDSVKVRFALADLQIAAPALQAALEVYTKEGRSLYERLPLLAALAQAGYYEDRKWDARYGDAALRALREVTALDLVRRLQSKLGKMPGLLLGLLVACFRFYTARRRNRRYGFADAIVHLFGVVTTMTGTAITALDAARANAVAAVMEPFMHLPERLTPVGIGRFCRALSEIARERQATALAAWEQLTERFESSRFYVSLPLKARPLYVGGLWFARGVFESFRDGPGALRAAEQCERTGLKLYRMIAAQVRMLYHLNRGETLLSQRYREQVELHAIQIGTASQVELWEPAAQILPYAAMNDWVELRRVAERLRSLAEAHPSLQLYARLAHYACESARVEHLMFEGGQEEMRYDLETFIPGLNAMLAAHEPRSFIGWAALSAYFARGLNLLGRHEQARDTCARALAHLGPEDRPFVMLFLACEIELAVAEAGLGDVEAARKRLDELLAYHAHSDNPLTRGRLHEGYAHVARLAADWPTFRHHLEETRRWYRSTGTPVLIARAERIAALGRGNSAPPATPPREDAEEAATQIEPTAQTSGMDSAAVTYSGPRRKS